MPWYNAVTGEHVHSPSDNKVNRDELVYKPSIYAKEELPTWAEVYEEFYLGMQTTFYDSKSDTEIDPYWKIPHKKFLIAVVCNQFNKMLYEDRMMKGVCDVINDTLGTNITALQFTCGNLDKLRAIYNNESFGTFFSRIHEIYTIPLPTGKPNPFITSDYTRININDIDGIFAIQVITDDLFTGVKYFNKIIEIMITRFKSYFSGDIGWKDSDGKVIEGDPGCRDCTGAGYCAK